MRSLPSDVMAALSGHFSYCHLVELHLATPLYLTDAGADIQHQGKTYLASGHLQSIDDLVSSSELRIDDLSLEFSAVDQSLLAALQAGYMNRQVRIHTAILNEVGQPIGVVDDEFIGVIDTYKENEDDSTNTLEIVLSNELAVYQATAGRQCNPGSQQRFFPNDTAFRHALAVDLPKGEWGHEDLATGGGLFAEKMRMPAMQVEMNLDASAQAVPVVYGQAEVEGTVCYKHVTGQDKRYLAVVDVLCEGPIHGVVESKVEGYHHLSDEGRKRFGIDGRSGNGRPYIHHTDWRLGEPGSAAFEWLKSYPAVNGRFDLDSVPGVIHPGNSSTWPEYQDSDTFDGLATWLWVFRNHIDGPWSGAPSRRYVVKGQLVWDPRDAAQDPDDWRTWEWSDNPALCVLDYLRSRRYGWGIPLVRIQLSSFIDEANWCDTQVIGNDGSSRPIMRTNLVINTGSSRVDNLRSLLDSMRGRLRRPLGLFALSIERDQAPVMALDDDDLISVSASAESIEDRFNRVIVEFRDRANDYQTNSATWPPADSDLYQQYLTEDLGVIQEEKVTLDGIDNWDEAIQAAEVLCRKSRAGYLVDAEVMPRCAVLEGNDLVTITSPDRGWSNKPFRVENCTVDYDRGVRLELREHNAQVYPWSAKDTPPPAPDYSLPDPLEVPAPHSLGYVAPTDLQPQGQLTWSHDWEWTAHYRVVVKKNGVQVASGTSADGSFPIPPLDAGDYQVTVTRVSNLGKSSDPVTLGFTLAAPALPVIAPEGITVDNTSVTLAPATAGLSYGTAFEFAFRGTAADGERVIELRSRGHYIRANLALETRYYFSVRAVNSLGVSDWLEVSATTTRNATVVNDLLDVPPGTSVGESLTQFDRDIGITSWDAFMAAIEGCNAAQETAEQGQTQATLLQGQQLQAEAQSAISAQVKALQAQTATAEALIAELQRASVFERGAIAEQSTSLTAKIGEAQAESLEYTRTAVGYWEDGNGVIQSETDPEFDAPEDWVWREGPLAEVIRKLKIQTANGYASYQQLGQAFETVDGEPRARGGWIIDENGQQTGVVGHAGRLDLLAALLRMGVMVDGQYKSLFELDANTNTLRIVASLVLGDGHTIRKVEDIRGQDGVSPSVSKVGNTVTITAPDGTSVTVSDGSDGYTPQKGTDYHDGADGQHGTSHLYIKANNGYLPESSVITSALTTVLGRAPIQGDMVTYYALDASNLPVRANDAVYSGSVWQPFQLVVNGSAIVHGSLRADVLAADSTLTVGTGNNVAVMSGQGSYRLWAGHASAASAPFRVTQSGKVVATDVEVKGKVEATSGSFDNVTINETCTIKKVNAEVIEGDIYLEAFAKGPWRLVSTGNLQYKLFGIRVATAVPFTRVLQLTSGISVTVDDSSGDYLKRARVELIGPGVSWIGEENGAWLSGPGGGYDTTAQFADPITVTIPANTKGDYTLYLRVLDQSRNPTLDVFPTGNGAGVGVSLYRKGASLTII